MRIPYITEPAYSSASIWCAETCAGMEAALSRKKYSSAAIGGADYRLYDYDALFSSGESRMVLVIATSPSWVPEVTDFLEQKGIDVILVSSQPTGNTTVRGTVCIDYAAGVRTLLAHLRACGCRRTALYGCFGNSFADQIKRQAFAASAGLYGFDTSSSCFENSGRLSDCYAAFRPHIGEYDAVLCVNDIAAVSLAGRLRTDGVRVPEDMQIACFGGSEIARLYDPPITALINDNIALGQQAVEAYAYLCRAGDSVNISVRVEGRLAPRGSTGPADGHAVPPSSKAAPDSAPSFYADDEVRSFSFIETLLTDCDAVDLTILRGLLAGQTGEKIAEALALAPETVRYRIRRIVQTAGVKNRVELLETIRKNPFCGVIDKNQI